MTNLYLDDLSVNFMKKSSAVIVSSKDKKDVISIYKELLGRKLEAK